MSGVIRTSCSTGWPLPELEERPLSSGAPAPPAPAVGAPADCAPKPIPVPDAPRAPKPVDVDGDDGELPLSDRRSPLEVVEGPDPGAIWLSALSSRPEDEPPMNMSVSTRAIWRASPYFTR